MISASAGAGDSTLGTSAPVILWHEVESALVRDGSLWDIFVQNTDVADWERVLVEIKSRSFKVVYNAAEADQPLVRAADIFALDINSSPSLFVWDRGTRFNTYFDESEILFDVHPKDVYNQETLNHLTDFMVLLGNATQKVVRVSPDNLHDFVFLTYSPSDNGFSVTPLPRPPESLKADEIHVLGQQMADARRAEEVRLSNPEVPPSSFPPDAQYDRWYGDVGLSDPIRGPVDNAIADFCRIFAATDSIGKSRIRASTSLNDFYTLLAFAKRSAVFAMRARSEEHILEGVRAISIVDANRIDYRDAYVALSLVDHAAREIGASADILFEKAAMLAEPKMSGLILDFLRQPESERDIHTSSGYTLVETEVGPGFLHWNLEPYRPTGALDRIALALAEVMRHDKYQPTFVWLAAKLPAIWLSSVDDELLNKALFSTRACARITGELRPQESSDNQWQHLMLFLAELGDEASADTLLRLSEQKAASPGSPAMVGVREGRLFCLIVQRSVVLGKADFETRDSIRRFTTKIAQILKGYVQQ